MTHTHSRSVLAMAIMGLIAGAAAAQSRSGSLLATDPAPAEPTAVRAVPAEKAAAAVAKPGWQPPKTSWGHPSLEGVWSTDDMRSVPMGRPAEFGTRTELNAVEFLDRASRDQGAHDESERVNSFLQHEYGVRTFGYTSMIIDPINGQLPALTEAGKALAATRVRGTYSGGPFNTIDDFTLYDRCITRGALGSLLPVIYGNGVRIAQSPDRVAISYEMIHDTRIVYLDGREAVSGNIHQYLGSARGRWEGNTLVIESNNFTNKTNVGVNGGGVPNSEKLKLTERLTRVDPEMIEYLATIEDPVVLTAPFTLRLMITTQPGYMLYEYNCHEGNEAVFNALTGERAYEKMAAEAAAKGLPIPRRATEHTQIRNGRPDSFFNVNKGE